MSVAKAAPLRKGDNCDFTIAGKYPSVIYSALDGTALYSNEGIINKLLLITRSRQLVSSWLVSRMTYRLTNWLGDWSANDVFVFVYS